MKKFALCFAAAVCCFLPVFAETGILVPREVFVADEAELGFETTVFAGAAASDAAASSAAASSAAASSAAASSAVLSVPPADLPVSADITIKSIQVKIGDTSAQVTVRFVPWKSGLLQLPSFTLAGVRVTPPPVRIASLVDKTGRTVLERERSPLLVPGTTYLLYGLVAVFLAVCALAIAAAVHIRKHLSRFLEINQAGRRLALIHKQLRLLEKQARKTAAGEWYRTFAAVLRMYLGSLCAGDSAGFSASTATEIVTALGAVLCSASGVPVSRVRSLLQRTDTVRFSGYPVPDTRLRDITEARELVALLEAEATAASMANAVKAARAKEAADVQL